MRTINAHVLSALLAEAVVPTDTIRSTVESGGYPSDPGVYVVTDSPTLFARACVALSEAIGDGASREARSLLVSSRGGTYGGARELCAHLPGWVLDGPLTELDDVDDLEPAEVT